MSLSAATAAGAVTSSQKAERPPSNDAAITAAIGMRTMSVRYAVESPRTRPPARLDPPVRAGSVTASGLVVSGHSQLVLDVEEDALLAVEEARADVGPPAEVGDREEAGRAGGVELASRRPRRPGGSPWRRRPPAPRACRGSRGTPAPPPGSRSSFTTATGFSIRIVSAGTTYSSSSPACWAKIASFS